jgi:NTP pyrophosphatase (non-canonical NTP hydrolase)
MSVVKTSFDLKLAQGYHPASPSRITECVDKLVYECHAANVAAGWWTNIQTGEKAERNVGEMLMLCVSELSEGLEGDRKDLMDDKLPHRKMLEVELADCMIRICDLAGAKGYDLGGALAEKMAYNASRLDHTLAHRSGEGGKKY